MYFIDIIILGIAILLFGLLAFKKVNAIILAPLISLFVIICSGLPILETLSGPFMTSAADYFKQYFLVFFTGALFGVIYQFTGAASSIGYAISKISKGRFVAPMVMIITGILTYGGVSGFVVFFAIYPIELSMFKNANVSRIILPAAISAGCWTWSMNGPGSPSIQNVIPMRTLGTTATAAFIPGMAAMITQFVLIFIWLEYRSRKLSKAGRVFNDPTLTPLDPEELKSQDPSQLPNPILSLLPVVIILVSFNLLDLPVETAVMIGVISAFILFCHRIPSPSKWVEIFNQGAGNAVTAIINTAIVVGFGGVVKNTQGFDHLISILKNMDMAPMLFVAVTVAVTAGAAGSASGGISIAFDALKDTYMSMGLAPEYIHRIAAIAAGTLDTLPHQGAQITLLNICKLSHKEAYMDIAITQILIPFIGLIVFMPFAALGL